MFKNTARPGYEARLFKSRYMYNLALFHTQIHGFKDIHLVGDLMDLGGKVLESAT